MPIITVQPTIEPIDDIHIKQSQTHAFVKSIDLGVGTLYVAER